jgi:hypothetical protein
MLYIETLRPNTNRHVHAHKCLHCAGIEPATSCVVGEYSHHYATSTVKYIHHLQPCPHSWVTGFPYGLHMENRPLPTTRAQC